MNRYSVTVRQTTEATYLVRATTLAEAMDIAVDPANVNTPRTEPVKEFVRLERGPCLALGGQLVDGPDTCDGGGLPRPVTDAELDVLERAVIDRFIEGSSLGATFSGGEGATAVGEAAQPTPTSPPDPTSEGEVPAPVEHAPGKSDLAPTPSDEFTALFPMDSKGRTVTRFEGHQVIGKAEGAMRWIDTKSAAVLLAAIRAAEIAEHREGKGRRNVMRWLDKHIATTIVPVRIGSNGKVEL